MGAPAGKIVAMLVSGLALALPCAAQASQTIGQTGSPLSGTCTDDEAYVQRNLVAGPSYSPSAYGVITSWSTGADASSNQTVKLAVFRQDNATQFSILRRDIVRTLTTPNALNTFTGLRLPIDSSERLGIYIPATSNFSCEFGTGNSGDTVGTSLPFGVGEPPDNTPFNYSNPGDTKQRVNAQAVVEPDTDRDVFGDESQDNCVGTPGLTNGCPNTVTISGLKQKGKKPKLSLTATIPGQGKLSVGSASDATVATAAAKSKVQLKPLTQTFSSKSAQQVVLTLALTKSAKSKLRAKGKLKLQVKIAFTPTGGSAGSQLSKAKLKS